MTSNVICQQTGQPRRNKFLETYSLPRLSLEETSNLNRSITRKVRICKNKNSLQTKVQDQMASLGN